LYINVFIRILFKNQAEYRLELNIGIENILWSVRLYFILQPEPGLWN
jgi:hypothetical protein